MDVKNLLREHSFSGRVQGQQRCACRPTKRCRTQLRAKSSEDSEKPDPGLGLKAVWIGAENFGKLVGLGKGKPGAAERRPLRTMSRGDVVQSIRDDYSVNYFVSGKGDMEAYDPECLFADPFAGFNGVDRFKQNVSNLGGLMEDIQLDLTEFQEDGDEVRTKWKFSALLQLPWRPRLAAAGGTKHVLDKESGRVVKHIESWDVKPGKVLLELVKPANKTPANKAEAFMLGLSRGDVKSMWLASDDLALLSSLPLVALAILTRTFSGHGLPGFVGGGVEAVGYFELFAALSAKAYTAASK